jgi:hypothetical protein
VNFARRLGGFHCTARRATKRRTSGGARGSCRIADVHEQIEIMTLLPEPMHTWNRFDHYLFGYNGSSPRSHGWFPADVVEQSRIINAPQPAASSTQLNINDNELQFAAVRDGYSSHGFSLRQWTPLPNTQTKSVAQPWTLPPTGANPASSGFASILRFRSQDPLKIHSRSTDLGWILSGS